MTHDGNHHHRAKVESMGGEIVDVAEIARKLTKAQREALLDAWHRGIKRELSVSAFPSTRAALQRAGVLAGPFLTPLGLSAREHLLKETPNVE